MLKKYLPELAEALALAKNQVKIESEAGEQLPPPTAPMTVAREFVRRCCTYNGAAGELTLRYWNGGWWTWRTTHWAWWRSERCARSSMPSPSKRSSIDEGKFKPWSPTRRKIGDLLEALAAIVILADEFEPPCWIDGRDDRWPRSWR